MRTILPSLPLLCRARRWLALEKAPHDRTNGVGFTLLSRQHIQRKPTQKKNNNNIIYFIVLKFIALLGLGFVAWCKKKKICTRREQYYYPSSVQYQNRLRLSLSPRLTVQTGAENHRYLLIYHHTFWSDWWLISLSIVVPLSQPDLRRLFYYLLMPSVCLSEDDGCLRY